MALFSIERACVACWHTTAGCTSSALGQAGNCYFICALLCLLLHMMSGAMGRQQVWCGAPGSLPSGTCHFNMRAQL
jgi:hypothetical protein